MGYNKIVFVRNDLLNNIESAPKSVVARIGSYGGDKAGLINRYAISKDTDEPIIPSGAMTVFPEVHASHTAVYVLAGNTCKQVLGPETRIINGKLYYLVPVGFDDEDVIYAE